MTWGPLEKLGQTDIDTPAFGGQPSDYCGAAGAQADTHEATWRQSVRARFPPSTHYREHAKNLGSLPASQDTPIGEPDRLRLIGRTREIERYPGETDTQYCERLANAFTAWRAAGTPSAIVSQLRAFGFVDVLVFEEYAGGFYTISPDYGWRFVVVIGPDFGSVGWLGCLVGTAVVGTSTVGLGNGTALQLGAIKQLIVKWKQVFAFPLRFVLVFGDPPIVGLAIVGGAVIGGGTTSDILMGDVRAVGTAIVGETPLWGLNL